MTLVVTIANEWGVWQCADHLLSLPASGKKHAHSWKSLHVDCTNGGLLVGFSGVGSVLETATHDEGLVVSWLRGALRGETRTVDDTLFRINDQANAVLAPRLLQWSKQTTTTDMEHTFVFGGFEEMVPRMVTSSFSPSVGEFVLAEHPVGKEGAYRIIGVATAVGSADVDELARICAVHPSSEEDFKRLLANINKRASQKSTAISEACSARYLAPAGMSGSSRPFFHEGAELDLPVEPTMMISGADATDLFQSAMDQIVAALEDGVPVDDIEVSYDESFVDSSSKPDTRLTKRKKDLT